MGQNRRVRIQPAEQADAAHKTGIGLDATDSNICPLHSAGRGPKAPLHLAPMWRGFLFASADSLAFSLDRTKVVPAV